MPTYEYECEDCDVRFEKEQKLKSRPLKRCPDCKGSVHRLLFSSSFSIDRGVTTIGKLAESNSRRAGASIAEVEQLSGKKEKREGRELTNKINAMTETQKIHYIENGL